MKVVDFLTKDVLHNNPEILDKSVKWLFEKFDIHYGMIDRTRTFDTSWCKVLYNIPKITHSIPFEDICLNRALSLINENKPISLFWSGGVDSTTALCALLKAEVRKDQLTIFYNDLSVIEYPKMYVDVVKKYNSKKVKNYFDDVPKDSLIVTGECGDQIFGSQFIPSKNEVIGGKIFTTKGITRRLSDLNKDVSELEIVNDKNTPKEFYEFISKAPFKLKTKYDLFWWIDFVFRWQHMNLRIAISSDKDEYSNFLMNTRAFFNYDKFQIWSMDEYNHREVKQTHSDIIKKPAKDFIRSVFNDDAYYHQKPKIGSLPSAYRVSLLGRWEDGTVSKTKEHFNEKLNESN